MLFIIFCMFCIYGGFICESPEIDGKAHVKTPDLRSPKNSKKIKKSFFREISHGARRGHEGEPPGAGATPGCGWDPSLGPVAPIRHPFNVLLPFDLKMSGASTHNFFRRLCEAETRQRE